MTATVHDHDSDRVAADLLAGVYDALLSDGIPEQDAAATVTRILFLLAVDGLNLLGQSDTFSRWVKGHEGTHGEGFGKSLTRLFDLLDTPEDDRTAATQPHFPYVNGSLFSDPITFPNDLPETFHALHAALDHEWATVNPAIFGSLFQHLRSKDDRHDLGQHYTHETDVLKVIGPMFLDGLTGEFSRNRHDKNALIKLRERISSLRFLDPAAGAGNFLVITFKHLAALDLDILTEIRYLENWNGQMTLGVDTTGRHRLSSVTLDQFHGIEIDPWPSSLARIAMHVARAQANRAIADRFGITTDITFPLPHPTHDYGVRVADALTLDWNAITPITEGTFIFGNPPFLAFSDRTPQQRATQKSLWKDAPGAGQIDFAANWFLLAARYMAGTKARAAFVVTDSLTHGSMPATLWRQIQPLGIGIDFAYRPFPWSNGEGQQASIDVVIIGFSALSKPPLRSLWLETGQRTEARTINVYLTDAPDVIVDPRATVLSPLLPPISLGSQPTDAQHLTRITPAEATQLQRDDPIAAKYLRRFVGSDELISGKERWCLWLVDLPPNEAQVSNELASRISAVAASRAASVNAPTRQHAATPHLFHIIRQPETAYLAMPRYSSSAYVRTPIGFLPADVIASESIYVIPDPDMLTFGLLSSIVFNVWTETLSGRIGSTLRIGASITYNTFPTPDMAGEEQERIRTLASDVIQARETYPNTPLRALYNAKKFPGHTELAAAHKALDEAVLAAYGLPARAPTGAILRLLFQTYQNLT